MSSIYRIGSSVLAACFTVLAVGCSSSSTGSPSAADASSPSDASSGSDSSIAPEDAGVDGNTSTTCPTIPNTAQIVTSSIAGTTAPVGTGGTIVDGTYHMTAQVQYPGGSTEPEPHQYTLKITGNQVDLTGHSKNDADQSVSAVMTGNSATGAMKWIVVCPAALAGKDFGITSYTATATNIHFYKPTNDAFFAKQ